MEKKFDYGFDLVWNFVGNYTMELLGAAVALFGIWAMLYFIFLALVVFVSLLASLMKDTVKSINRRKENTYNKGTFREH